MITEYDILKFISERQVVPIRELFEKFSGNGRNSVKGILSSLESRGLVSVINPMGSDTVVITRQGLREAEKI